MTTAQVRILGFAGSTRLDSFNNQLVHIAEAGARDAGALVTHLDLRDYRLPLYDQDEESADGKPAEAKALKRIMMEHDAWLIAAPEYNSSITGVLKNTIDWVSRSDDGDESPLIAFRGKVVSLMSASPGALGGLRGLVHVRSILGNLGCIILPDQVAVRKAHTAFADGALVDERQHAHVVELGRTLAETVSRLAGVGG